MSRINDYLVVDMINREVVPEIEVVQADNLRGVVLSTGIKNADRAIAYVKKADGNQVYNDVAVDENGFVTVDFTSQMIAAIGTAWLQVELLFGAARISTFAIKMEIYESLIDKGGVESTDEYGALETATENAITATNNANAATAQAETATENAITATENAVTATNNANTATAQAETATQNAVTATENAVTATNNANTATAQAETATQNAVTATENAEAVVEDVEAALIGLQTETRTLNADGWLKGYSASGDDFPLVMLALKTGNVVSINVNGMTAQQWTNYNGWHMFDSFNSLPNSWRKIVTRIRNFDVYVSGTRQGSIFLKTIPDANGIHTATYSAYVGNSINADVAEINIHGTWLVMS